MREQDIRFRSADADLAGTLALPGADGPFPTVLLVAGSGQVDRDENCLHPKLRINALHDIAHHLAAHGIASLRYDKRGIGQSGGDYWSTGLHDHILDARSALEYLADQPATNPDRIFLLGHSEGALVSVALLATGAPAAGAILLAGAAQSGEAVLKWQALQVAKGITGINGWIIRALRIDVAKSQQKWIDKIKATDRDVIRRQFVQKLSAKWLREFMDYDPAPDLARISVPILAITGSNDIQVDPNDLDRMARLIQGPFEQHVVDGMTHVLRIDYAPPSISRYRREVREPVAPQLLEILTQWLHARNRPAV